MEQIIVYRKGVENLRLNRFKVSNESGIKAARQEREDLGKDIVRVELDSVRLIDLQVGDYVEVFGDRYVLNVLPNIEKTSDRMYSYVIEFEGKQYDLLKTTFIDVDSKYLATGGIFTMIGKLEVFAELIVNNLNRDGANEWELGDVNSDVNTVQTIPFSDNNCLQVAQQLCELYEVSYYVERVSPNKWKLHFKRKTDVLPDVLKYGRNNGLYSITQEPVKEGGLINRLFVYGSQKNLPTNYRGGSIRLKLPKHVIPSEALPYIQDPISIQNYGVVEGSVTYEDVFPSREGTVTAVGGTSYDFYDIGMDFDLTETINGVTTYLINGVTAKIVFTSGDLMGYEFEVSAYDHSIKRFTINPYTDENGIVFPDNTVLARTVKNGDKYIIYDIQLPQTYVSNAEMELLRRGREALLKLREPLVNYSVRVDPYFVSQKAPDSETIINYFEIGHIVRVQMMDGEIREMPIMSFSRDILRHYMYEVVLGEPKLNTQRKRFVQSVRVNSTVNNIANFNVGNNLKPNNPNNTNVQITNLISTILKQSQGAESDGGVQYVDVANDVDLDSLEISNYPVGTRFIWMGFGLYELVEGEPDSGYYIQSSIDSNFYFLSIDNTEWLNEVAVDLAFHLLANNPHSITSKMLGAWSSVTGLANTNRLLKVSDTTDFLLQDSLLSDDGTTLIYGGQAFRLPSLTGSIPLVNGNMALDPVTGKIKAVLGGARVDLLTSGLLGVPRTVWVDSVNGTDTRTGVSKYSIDTPFKTLGAAVAASTASTDIIVATGTFTENITFTDGTIVFNRGLLTGNISSARYMLFLNFSKWVGVHVISAGIANNEGVIEGDKTSEWELTGNLGYTFSNQSNIKRIRGFRRIYASAGTFSLFSGTSSITDALLLTRFKEIPYLIVEDIDTIECYNLCSSALIGFRNIKHIVCSNWIVGSTSVGVYKFDNVGSIQAVRMHETFNARGVYFLFNHTKVYASGTGTAYMLSVGANYTGYFYLFAYNSHFETASDRIATQPTVTLNSNTDYRTRVHLFNCTLKGAGSHLFGNSATTPMHELSLVSCVGNLAPANVTNNPATTQEIVNYNQYTLLRTDVF